MEILVIARGVPDEMFPQNGIFEFDQAVALQNEGINVLYLAIDIRSLRKKRKWGLVRDEAKSTKKLSVYTYNIPIGPLPLAIRLYVERMAVEHAFKRLYLDKRKKPDIVHCHFGLNGYAAQDLKCKGLPFIITEHYSEMNQPQIKRSILKYSDKAYHKADCVVAVSEALKKNIYLNTGIQSIVIHNMIDCGIFERNIKKSHEGFRFVTTSNLTEIKQIPFLIHEFACFHKEYPKSSLVIIGSGNYELELKKMAKESEASESINFYGKKSRKEIAEIYEKCDCFVMVSRSETFGVAFVEAIAAGLPVIGTDCGGPREFINNENGMIIPVNDASSFQKAMVYMYKHAHQYDVEKMRRFVKDHYSSHTIATQIIKLYETLLVKE